LHSEELWGALFFWWIGSLLSLSFAHAEEVESVPMLACDGLRNSRQRLEPLALGLGNHLVLFSWTNEVKTRCEIWAGNVGAIDQNLQWLRKVTRSPKSKSR